jgi:hypothetical protein
MICTLKDHSATVKCIRSGLSDEDQLMTSEILTQFPCILCKDKADALFTSKVCTWCCMWTFTPLAGYCLISGSDTTYSDTRM